MTSRVNHSEQVQRARLSGLFAKNRLVQALGLFQSTSAMK
jgi:hypothetical protein